MIRAIRSITGFVVTALAVSAIVSLAPAPRIGRAGSPGSLPVLAPQGNTPEASSGEAKGGEPKSPDGADTKPAVPPGVIVESELTALVEAHNRIRSEHELPPLKPNPELTAAARVHAIDMAHNSFMAHEGSDKSTPADRIARQGYRYQKVAENVAEGYRTVEAVMDGWMNSPHHRENILGGFEEIGAARATSEDGTPYWTVNFATPWPKLDPEVAVTNLVDTINARRQAGGKPPLKVDPTLKAVAMRHAREKAERAQSDRGGASGANPLDQVAAAGYRFRGLALADASGQPTAEEAVATWAEADGQKVDLLGNFVEVGPGYATDATGRPYWSVILGLPLRRR